MKAQSAMEYVLIFAFSLIALTVLFAYSNGNIQDTRWDIQVAYAKNALSKITEISDTVYVQGAPAQFYVLVSFPENVRRVYLENNIILAELEWKNGILRNVTSESIANLTGSVSPAAGTHKILIKADNDFVNLTES